MKDRFERFTGNIVELNRCLQKIKDIEMRKFGLRANHTMCLYYIGQHEEGLTATQLRELCKEDKAAISRCLNELIAKGYVHCELPENKRSYRTVHYLTDHGRELVEKVNNRIKEALFQVGDGLTEEQRNTFYDSMELIRGNLQQYLDREESKN